MFPIKGVLNSDELQRADLLLFANKQDMPGARSPAEIVDKMGLRDIRGFSNGQREFHVQACCAITGDGLAEGLDWLARKLKNKKK